MRICGYIPGASKALALIRQSLKGRSVIPEDINSGAFRFLRSPVDPMQLNKGAFLGVLDQAKRKENLSLLFVSHVLTGTTAIADTKWGHYALAQEIFPKFCINPKNTENFVGGRLEIKLGQDGWIEFAVNPSSVHFCKNREIGHVYARLSALASLCKFGSIIQRDDQGNPLFIKIHA